MVGIDSESKESVSDIDKPKSMTDAREGLAVNGVEISVPEDRHDTAATLKLTVDLERVNADESELSV